MLFDAWTLVPATAFALYIVFTVFGLAQHRVNRVRWSFLLYMGALTIWSFGSFMMRANLPPYTPLGWNRFMLNGLLAVPITLFHALLDLTGSRRRRRRALLGIGYAIWAFLVVLNFRGGIVTQAGFIGSEFYYRLGPYAALAYGLSYAYLLLGIGILIREIAAAADAATARKLVPPLVGGVILLLGVLANVDESIGRYPIDLLAATVNGLLIFVAIYKYRLVHYSQFVLHAIVYFLLIVFTAFLFSKLLLLTSSQFAMVSFDRRYLISLLIAATAAVIFQPLHRGATLTLERIYFGQRLKYYRSLRAFSASLTSMMNLDTLGETTIGKIHETFRLQWSFILVLDYARRNYRLLSSRGLSLPESSSETITFNRDSELIRLTSANSTSYSIFPEGMAVELSCDACAATVHPSLILPLRFQERTNGCIVLGPREDKDYYDQLDLETLQIFTGHCSIALENAISFERLRRKQKRLQEMNDELIISNNKLEAFFDGITAPMSLQDINYNVVIANVAAARFFGVSTSQLVGQKCYQVYFGREKPCEACLAQDSLHTQLPFASEMEHQLTGTSFSLHYYPISVPSGARPLFLEFFQDISEQKHLRAELVQSSKLAGIGTLVSGIAHEINNPLAAITATAEVILDEVEPQSTLREYAEDILRCSKDAASIIRDLNSYSRRDSPVTTAEADVNEALRTAVNMALRGLDSSAIEVQTDLTEIPPVNGNPNELRQVFLNLVINAIQAMHGRGRLSLRSSSEDGFCQVTVADTGEGIPEADLGNIFDPFFTTKPPGEGTGLGLSMVFQIVNKLRGRITVESSEGEGTVVRVVLPSARAQPTTIRFVQARSRKDYDDVFFLQRKILVGEKGYREETIHRSTDDRGFHILAYKGLLPVGTVTCASEANVGRLPVCDYFPAAGDMIGDSPAAEIERLAVIKEERGGLIPLGLMMLAYMHARAQGAEIIFLDVFSDDKKQGQMYSKLGFSEIGVYHDPSAVTVMMLQQQLNYETDSERLNHFLRPLIKRLLNRLDFDQSEYDSIMEQANRILDAQTV